MKLPEGHKFRAGDEVTVRASVRFATEAADEAVHVELVGSTHTRTCLERQHILTFGVPQLG